MTLEQENQSQIRSVTDEAMPASDDSSIAMRAQDKKDDNSERTPVRILPLAIRSVLSTFVIVALLFGCVISFSPYTAMRMYTALDLKELALVSAEKYLKRHSDEYNVEKNVLPSSFGKYSDALYLAVNNSIYLMNEYAERDGYDSRDTLYYARKVDKYASMYLSANVQGSLYQRTERVNSYNLLHTSPALHPYVYSYADSLERDRFKAWYLISRFGSGDGVLDTAAGEKKDERAEYYARMLSRVNTATTGWNKSSGEWTGESALTEAELSAAMLLFSQLSAYIETELSLLGSVTVYEDKQLGVLKLDDAIEQFTLLNANDIRTNLYDYKPFGLFVTEKGEFTGLYNDILYRYDYFIDMLRDNSRKYVLIAGNSPTRHLEFTYYLKSMKDFAIDMANMTAVLKAGRNFYGEDYRLELQKSNEDAIVGYEAKNQIRDVQITRDGVLQPKRRCSISDWYRYGMLYDYLEFSRVLN